ncbi:MAG: hypothetical protein KDE51_13190, partial [Anaerolineales bacterium]|nr:hypothetical protein [Anaerolineales bacterium]
MSQKSFKYFIVALVLSGIALLQTVSPAVQAQTPDPTAEQAVQTAWELAKASATYRYYSEIEQTAYPAPRLSSAGQRPTIDIIQLDGLYDQVDEKLELTMWNTAEANTPSEAIEIRVDGTEAKGRRGHNGQWEMLGTVNDFFAPGGDPLGFLSGATNIQYDSTTDYHFGTSSTQNPKSKIQNLYAFD